MAERDNISKREQCERKGKRRRGARVKKSTGGKVKAQKVKSFNKALKGVGGAVNVDSMPLKKSGEAHRGQW